MTDTDDDAGLVDILQDTLDWRLTEAQWQSARRALDRLAEARERGDRATERHAAGELIDCCGHRAADGLADAMRDPSRQIVPADVREVVYRLLRQVGVAGEERRDRPADTPGTRDVGAA